MRNKEQEDFSHELFLRGNNIYSVYPTNGYADASIIAENSNSALEEIASVTVSPETFNKSAVHIWQKHPESFEFKLPKDTQLRALTADNISRYEALRQSTQQERGED